MNKTLNYFFFLSFFVLLSVSSSFAGPCESLVNQPAAGCYPQYIFSPDAIGNHGLDYELKNTAGWPVTVKVYWRSDTYTDWSKFRELLVTKEFIWCISRSDDNVEYMIEFCSNSATATVDILFCNDW